MSRKQFSIIFYIYTCIMFFLVLFKFNFTYERIKESIELFRVSDYKMVNLDFLSTIKMQINQKNNWAFLNLFGNTIPFIFYGILFVLSFDTSLIKSILINLFVVLLIEIIQLIFVIGTFDIDDIFLNLTSIILGIILIKYTSFNKRVSDAI
ncbi:MAG: VanZ family protein [bacterium]